MNVSTICAIAAASGGALGVIRISGPKAITIADKVFRSTRGESLDKAMPYSVIFGQLKDGEELIDEVLLTVFRAPHSYTGEDSVEISCHGSPYILKRTLEVLIKEGCVMAQPGEYTKRAFLNGKMNLPQAEAVADLIASESAAAHRVAMQQMRGGYSEKLNDLRNQLLTMTSLLELELDFSEEDVEFADRQQLISLAEEIHTEIRQLTSSFRLGNAIKNGIPVAIIGAPNVGKSTLLNRLLRDDRAIVSDIQGTTRDVIEDTIILQGIQFRFIDTAGIRHTNDTIEKMGVERSVQAAKKAQIIILLTEPGVPYPEMPFREDQTVIRIINKTDSFQALTGKGVDELEKQLIATIPQKDSSALLVTNARHFEALSLADEDIQRVLSSLHEGLSGDLISEDLRQCLSHLSEILGTISTDEILGNIFQKFCVGK
ncbi:MAG: tRNA uridine-5-carboxymethylaminomethyl(34) synthesis GTPase MnmE [Bacteroidaceae bacterium]|nr:tRNA uridine-5-carboxymethylaminomethyl(34) synthesis GTPase MnmE [Bacteroidaceae bacterium]